MHRLRPSDIDAIKDHVQDEPLLEKVIATLGAYLLKLKTPSAVEIDDVSRIALQLRMANVWNAVPPRAFIEEFREDFDKEVIKALCEALNIDLGSRIDSNLQRHNQVVANARKALGLVEFAGHVKRSNNTRAGRRVASKITKSQLIDQISARAGLTKGNVKGIMETLVMIGHKELKRSGVFLVPGFAKFVVVKKPATKTRKGTNPFTGEALMFKAKPARRVIKARPVKAAKDAV